MTPNRVRARANASAPSTMNARNERTKRANANAKRRKRKRCERTNDARGRDCDRQRKVTEGDDDARDARVDDDVNEDDVGVGVDDGDDEDAEDGGGEDEDLVTRVGAFGAYGNANGAMSRENDEWATSQRTWDALARVLFVASPSVRDAKVWMPFYYDGLAGKRLRASGFTRVVHARVDFFARARDSVFVNSCGCVIDNPPYTGKGMKERVLRALVDANVPFCLLLPLGTLHSAMVREILDDAHVQAIVPRKCYVMKKGGAEVPFRYLVWLCYKMNLKRDLYLID